MNKRNKYASMDRQVEQHSAKQHDRPNGRRQKKIMKTMEEKANERTPAEANNGNTQYQWNGSDSECQTFLYLH